MSQPAGYSPSFKRPAEVMRMRRKRARSDAGVFGAGGQDSNDGAGPSSAASVRPFSPGPLLGARRPSVGGSKRRNPFVDIKNTRNPTKRKLVYNEDGTAEAAGGCDTSGETDAEGEGDVSARTTRGPGGSSFSASLTEAEKRERRDAPSEVGRSLEVQPSTSFSEDDSLFEEEEEEREVNSLLLKSPQAVAPASVAPPVCAEYPADWSLKTRLLFTSPLSLSWAEQPGAREQALGLSQHCRAHFGSLPRSLQDPRSCPELRCAFQQSLAYWQHPSLPWLSLFPRINAERSFAGRSAPWAQDAALQQSLMSDWSASLSSLYSLLKARLCPYFYLCSYQFTVMFRAAGLAGSSAITALVSPTTRGLREAMKAEGIEFSLPLVEERKKSSSVAQAKGHHGEEEGEEECFELKDGGKCQAGGRRRQEEDHSDEDLSDEDDGFSWLKEIGVQDKIKKPDSITIQLRKEGATVCLDHKPESAVCVAGPHTFTLINFLINCKSAVAAAGSQAGLPPTLLAPVAFRGATLQTLKARSVNVKSQVGSTYQNISSLEITGPILPSSLHAITTLLRPSQKGTFSATLYTHAPTAAMNARAAKQQSARPQPPPDLSGCGLHPAAVQQLQQPSSLGKSALTHLSMSNYSYTWKN